MCSQRSVKVFVLISKYSQLQAIESYSNQYAHKSAKILPQASQNYH